MTYPLAMYSPELRRDTVERLFDAVKLYGFEQVQFDFLSVCEEELPPSLEAPLLDRVKLAAADRCLTICAVNGTFNLIHPNRQVVAENIARFEVLAKGCTALGCKLITLCTGTRDRTSMWRWHEENESPEAWDDLLWAMEQLLTIAKRYDLLLGVEPEASNVVNTPEKARLLLDTMQSDQLKVIFDPANLFHVGDARPEKAISILEHAFGLLWEDIALAHGKDIHAGEGISFTGAGRGIVPYEHFFSLLESIGYQGPLVAHGIHSEADFPYSVAFLRSLL